MEQKELTNEQKMLNAFLEQPSIYKIDVADNTMLPDDLKKEKVLEFALKPPVTAVLAKCALVLNEIPDELKNPDKEIKLSDVVPYLDNMAEALSILIHGKVSDPPSWQRQFLVNNCTPKELFNLFREASLKNQSSFFLSCFQIAELTNPMTMTQMSPEK